MIKTTTKDDLGRDVDVYMAAGEYFKNYRGLEEKRWTNGPFVFENTFYNPEYYDLHFEEYPIEITNCCSQPKTVDIMGQKCEKMNHVDYAESLWRSIDPKPVNDKISSLFRGIRKIYG